MKKGIHPEYRDIVFLDASANFSFLTRSTARTNSTITWIDGKDYPVYRLDISSASHPFYTGKMRLLDVMGRVLKFSKKWANFRPTEIFTNSKIPHDQSDSKILRNITEPIQSNKQVNQQVHEETNRTDSKLLGVELTIQLGKEKSYAKLPKAKEERLPFDLRPWMFSAHKLSQDPNADDISKAGDASKIKNLLFGKDSILDKDIRLLIYESDVSPHEFATLDCFISFFQKEQIAVESNISLTNSEFCENKNNIRRHSLTWEHGVCDPVDAIQSIFECICNFYKIPQNNIAKGMQLSILAEDDILSICDADDHHSLNPSEAISVLQTFFSDPTQNVATSAHCLFREISIQTELVSIDRTENSIVLFWFEGTHVYPTFVESLIKTFSPKYYEKKSGHSDFINLIGQALKIMAVQ